MRALLFVAVALLLLTGCPGAYLAGEAMHEDRKPYTHPPNAKDYASWVGESKPDLETHTKFALLPREVRPVSDGSELWVLRSCPAKSKDREECCLYEFVLAGGIVRSYRSAGQCFVDCNMRPEAKVQGCINDAVVPAHYGEH